MSTSVNLESTLVPCKQNVATLTVPSLATAIKGTLGLACLAVMRMSVLCLLMIVQRSESARTRQGRFHAPAGRDTRVTDAVARISTSVCMERQIVPIKVGVRTQLDHLLVFATQAFPATESLVSIWTSAMDLTPTAMLLRHVGIRLGPTNVNAILGTVETGTRVST
jgi:hypothetical protein